MLQILLKVGNKDEKIKFDQDQEISLVFLLDIVIL